ncbi:MAG TPA: hypothetical protein VG992_04220 [Candidatus Saccharimonadales bacterium]|nr:hypothetical protein [Candidatus Saccharimonadales bacterium]
MLDVIAAAHTHTMLSDTDKQVIGALLGALIGAVAGSIGTYLVGENARKKQRELSEIDKIRQQIKASTGALVAAQNNLHNLLVMALKNAGHSRDITKGIYDSQSRLTTFTMNLPLPYQIENGISDGVMNTNLVIQWDALETEVMLHNSNIIEFNDYYSFLRTSVHSAQLTNPNSLNLNTVISDSTTIASGAQQQVEACAHFRERCIKVLALVECHVAQYKKIDYKTITLAELEEYRQKLIDHKPSDSELKKKIEAANDQYTEDKAFGVNATL